MHISDVMKMREKDIYKLFPKKAFFKPEEHLINMKNLTIEKIEARVKDRIFLETGETNNIQEIKADSDYLLISHETLPIIINAYKKSSNIKTVNSIKKFIEKILSKDQIKSNEYRVTKKENVIAIDFYYKELVITNSLGLEHTMKDFYITYLFTPHYGKLMLVNIKIIRGALTIAEYVSNYHFSHASGHCIKPIYLVNLCFGSDTDIREIVNNAILGYLKLIDFSHFLHTMYSYFTWESVEGAPYKYIQNIKNYKLELKAIPSMNEYSQEWREIIHQLTLNLNNDTEFDITVDKNDIRIVITSGLHNIYRKCIEICEKTFPKDYMDKLLLHQDGDIIGNFKAFRKDDINMNALDDINIEFGSEVRKAKIDDTVTVSQEEIDNMYPKTLAKNIIIRIKREIEDRLTIFLNLNYKKIENYD